MDRRLDRGAVTRNALLDVAERLFSENGYEATSIEIVLRASSVSRGALYHHFANKETLFVAVLERVEVRIASSIGVAAAVATNPLDALREGYRVWLRYASDPIVRRIVLLDAPSVIGWQTWRAMDDRYSLGLLKTTLHAAASLGRLPVGSVDMYAHVVLAALIELALLVARNPGDAQTLENAHEAAETVVAGIIGVRPHAPWSAS